MKKTGMVLAGMVLASSINVEAAISPFYQKNKFTTIRNGEFSSQTENRRYDFRVEIIGEEEGVKSERIKNGVPFVSARPEERYAVRLYNPLPVRVAVNLTIDGLNTISGKPSGISDGSKWMIDPYSYVTIRGWQVNDGESRRFFFTEKSRTYAAWRGEKLNRDISVNCGVIGAAYFWNKDELQQYFDANPTVICTMNNTPRKCGVESLASPLFGGAADSAQGIRREEAKEKAGTGMGEREYHPTHYVDFRFNTGMYKPAQAMVIYYDFALVTSPNPFPGLSYAPEMD